eukprot:scaffold282124_cov33-Tisochrysis_lutea.AAC.2
MCTSHRGGLMGALPTAADMKRVRPTPVGERKKQVRNEDLPSSSRRPVTMHAGGVNELVPISNGVAAEGTEDIFCAAVMDSAPFSTSFGFAGTRDSMRSIGASVMVTSCGSSRVAV